MNRISFVLLLAGLSINAQAGLLEDVADGWASQNGGTDGGKGGTIVRVTTLNDLNDEIAKTDHRIILFDGVVFGSVNIKNTSNKTIFGLPGAKINGNISISGSTNIILRNFIVQGDKCNSYEECKSGNDAVGITYSSTRIWIDHCDIMDGQDGNLDINALSDYVTVSYSKFSYTYDKEHRFSNLIGSADSLADHEGKLNTTYHHCWWADRVDQRQPRTRYGNIHVANNLYTSTVSSYMVNAGYHTHLLVESNVMNAKGTPISVDKTTYGCTARNNTGSNASNSCSQYGAGFTPPYTLRLDATSNLETLLKAQAGATLPDPRSAVSSSSNLSSSSSSSTLVPSSSSIPLSSSSAITQAVCGNSICDNILEGEDFCNADGVLESKNTGYQGTGYINLDNALDASAGYVLQETTGESRTLYVRYANGGTSTRDIKLRVGTQIINVDEPFETTDSWTTWVTAEISVQLPIGIDSLVFQSLSSDGGPNIDWIGWNGTGLTSSECRTSAIAKTWSENRLQMRGFFRNGVLYFYTQIPANTLIRVRNLSGALVQELHATAVNRVPLSLKGVGVYLVEVRQGQNLLGNFLIQNLGD